MELSSYPDFDSYINKLVDECSVIPGSYDICITTGGLACFTGAGFSTFMYHMQINNKLNIDKIYCGSAGVMVAIHLILAQKRIGPYKNKVSTKIFLDMYDECMQKHLEGEKIMDSYINIFTKQLKDEPEAYTHFNDKVYIYMRELPYLNTIIVSKFNSNQHLLDCIKASGTIPYITTSNMYTIINNKKYVDSYNVKISALKKNNIKIFNPIIFMNFSKVKYNILYRMQAIDKNALTMCLSGILDAYRFFKYKRENSIYYIYSSLISYKTR